MIETIQTIKGDILPIGPQGLSAYQIYKKNGGTLSETEWLNSLKGATGEKGDKGDTGSVKFIVVTELPTENIDETAIYLKPVESPTGENNFEELIYVNGKWEDLGTPNVAVDLSNYYTKTESDEKLLTKQDKLVAGDNIEISDDNVISVSGVDKKTRIYNASATNSLNNCDLNTLGEAITNMFKDNCENPILRIYITHSTTTGLINNYTPYYDFYKVDNKNKNSDTYSFRSEVLTDVDGYPTTSNTTKLQCYKFIIFGTWNEDTFTCDRISTDYLFNSHFNEITLNSNVLTKTNTSSYTPTADYHPSTKKYVDDNILLSRDKCFYFLEGILRYDMAGTITNTDTLDKISKIMTDYYPKYLVNTNLCCVIFGKDDTTASNGCFIILQGVGTQFFYTYPYRKFYERNYGKIMSLSIVGNWNESTQTYTANSNSAVKAISYTPSDNYNPATKKYVDDAIAALKAELTGGSE